MHRGPIRGGRSSCRRTISAGAQALLDKHGILLIVDEIQSGMGRTGKMFAIEHTGIEPDILCVAKGIASGMPMGAMISKASLHTWKAGAHANTFGGNPVACASALKTIELIRGGLMANAAKVGAYLKNRLHQFALQFDIVGDVRGRGLMVGMEIVKDHETREPFPQARDAIVDSAFYHGLLIIGCGESTIRFCPPLVCSTRDVDGRCRSRTRSGMRRAIEFHRRSHKRFR